MRRGGHRLPHLYMIDQVLNGPCILTDLARSGSTSVARRDVPPILRCDEPHQGHTVGAHL
jgi:hypothetical protein